MASQGRPPVSLDTQGSLRPISVRGRAFTQIEDSSSASALADYVTVSPPTSEPSTPPRSSGKTLEIKHLVSPVRSPARSAVATVKAAVTAVSAMAAASPAAGASKRGMTSPKVTTPGSIGRDLFNNITPNERAFRASMPAAPASSSSSSSPPARATDDTDLQREKARRVSEWRNEAARLSARVRELEKENQQLRRRPSQSAIPPRTLTGGEYLESNGTASLSDQENQDGTANGSKEHIRTRMRKAQSVASGFGFTGRTVAQAAAASHRSRSKRLGATAVAAGAEPLQKYKSGYWNDQGNVTSSFSCNNLSDMEHRALALERLQEQPQPLRSIGSFQKAHSTNTKSSAKANRDIAAMMRSASRKSDSFQRSSLESSGQEMAALHKQQLAIAKSFRGSNVTRASPSSHRKDRKKDRKDLDIDELSDDSDEAVVEDVDDQQVPVTSPRSYFKSSLRGIGGSFRLPNKSTALAAAKRPSSGDVRLWVGTWNMGAADPFVDKSGIIDEQASAAMLQQFVPHGYQVYVLGLQEGVSENAYHAVAAYLNRNETGTRYYRLELRNGDSLVANKNHPEEATIDAVRGRGDGAFVGTKFTGIAVFYAAPIQDKIKLLRAGVHKFALTSGSKGGVAAALLINQTSIVFVNCHLDARNDSYRREQIRNLNANLGKVMGHSSFDLTEQFHHVVWMGDMNYRIVHLDPDIVLHMLEEGRNAELHDKFDGLLNDRRNGGVFDGFTEPNKFPDFYPTYKKFPKRGQVNYRLPSWSRLVYRVLYKEPFYKGGKVKKRVPGWCDRILIHSLLVGDSKLMPEKVVSPFEEQPTWIDNYRSVNEGEGMDVSDHSPVFATFTLSFPQQSDILNSVSPRRTRRNSRSMSTVSLRDSLSLPRSSVGGSYFDNPNVVRRIAANVPNRPVSTVLRVFNMQLYWNDNVVVPKRTRVVAPLIGEDIKQCDVIGERCQGTSGLNLSLNAVVQHTRPLEHLHMLVSVKHETISGHCTLSLKRIARQDEGGEVKFRVPLYNNSMRLYYDGHPLVLVFSVRSKTFAKNLDSSLQIRRFRVLCKISEATDQQLIRDFFQDVDTRALLRLPTGADTSGKSPLCVCQLRATVTSLSFFDRLVDAELVTESGSLRRCLDDVFDGATASDLLKKSFINPDTEDEHVFSDQEQQEFIYHLFRALVVGGSMCQSDESIAPYEDMTGRLYKALVSVKKNAADRAAVDVTSRVYLVDDARIFDSTSPYNACFVVLDPKKRWLTVWHNTFRPFW